MKISSLKKISAIAPLVFAVTFANQGQSETMRRADIPADAMHAAPESLVRMYAGRTVDWGGGSGAYYGRNGQFRAINPAEQSIGFGTWHVTTASRMCYQGTWVWRQDFGLQSREVDSCARYMIDAEGQVWTTTETMAGPWFPFFDDNINTGDAISAGFNALAAQLGVELKSDDS